MRVINSTEEQSSNRTIGVVIASVKHVAPITYCTTKRVCLITINHDIRQEFSEIKESNNDNNNSNNSNSNIELTTKANKFNSAFILQMN